MKKKIHLISFDNPYPPNYGGVIDVYYKIKAFYELGVEITLHVFKDGLVRESDQLNKYCKKVYYYQRNNKVLSLFSTLPFRVKSRESKLLTKRLKESEAAIIFEGLHSSSSIVKEDLKSVYVRAHNVEHDYFLGLSKSENNFFKKIFFRIESIKLKKYERRFEKLSGIFSIAPKEQLYFSSNYNNAFYIPAFHEDSFSVFEEPSDKFVLWHGDLRVSDNVKSVLFLIEVYKESNFKFKIASSTYNKEISQAIGKIDNIEFVELLNDNELLNLLYKAHVNALFTFQATGIKLKLLNALYKGRFILGNSLLTKDTGLSSVCNIADSKKEFLMQTKKLFSKPFDKQEILNRKIVLESFSPKKSAQKMLDIIFSLDSE